MHNRKILVKRIIEEGNRQYVQGVFGPLRYDGTRQLEAVVEGTRKDAFDMLAAGRTESGNTFKGFKKVKR